MKGGGFITVELEPVDLLRLFLQLIVWNLHKTALFRCYSTS